MHRTCLFPEHQASGARLIDFGGWEMPLQYTSIVEEHRAVREAAGLFDVSHMGRVWVEGADALAFLQKVLCNDAAKPAPGQAQYTLITLPSGGVLDDLLLYRRAEGFLLVVNAANRERDLAWFREQAEGMAVELTDRTFETAMMALQGPRAASILAKLVPPEVLELPYYAFAEAVPLKGVGTAQVVSRTGYTGEDGFELIVDAELGPPLWRALLAAGAEAGLRPAGLGARDTLRLEACMPLYGHELTEETTPLEAGLKRYVALDKGPFIGREALLRQAEAGVPRKLVAFRMEGKGVPRQGYPLLAGGTPVGTVTSGGPGITVGGFIGMGYVPPEHAAVGAELAVEIRGRGVPARVVKKPFYRRKRG